MLPLCLHIKFLWWYSNETCLLYKLMPGSDGISHPPKTVESLWIQSSESYVKFSRTLRSSFLTSCSCLSTLTCHSIGNILDFTGGDKYHSTKCLGIKNYRVIQSWVLHCEFLWGALHRSRFCQSSQLGAAQEWEVFVPWRLRSWCGYSFVLAPNTVGELHMMVSWK